MKKYVKTFKEFINEDFDFKYFKNLSDDEDYALNNVMPRRFGMIIGSKKHNPLNYKNTLDDFLAYIDANKEEYTNSLRATDDVKKSINWDKIKDTAKDNWSYLEHEIDGLSRVWKFEDEIERSVVTHKTIKRESVNFNELYDDLTQMYESIDGYINIVEISQYGEDYVYITIPITTDGSVIELEPDVNKPNEIEGIIISLELEKFINDSKYIITGEYDDENIFELGEGISENFEDGAFCINLKNGEWSKDTVIIFLDDLLSSVPNPALRKVSE